MIKTLPLKPATLSLCIMSFCPTLLAEAPIADWSWFPVNPDAPWVRRAGLQVLEVGTDFYLLGGRTARPPATPPIPGDSDIWNDVWKSSDQGATWEEILPAGPGHWPARAYFRGVTLGDEMYVLGGQDFLVIPNKDCPPPYEDCSPFISVSNFYNDVWSSTNGVEWTQQTDDAGWSVRAGLSSIVFNDEIYVIGGSYFDDSSIIGGPPQREYYNDVWKSADGASWTLLTEEAAFTPRAGAAVAVKDGFLYLFGGEEGFLCDPFPGCELPYFNDVWRTSDGIEWELLTPDAPWSARPGHVVVVADDQFVLFGGFGVSPDPTDPFGPGNPMDVWVSDDGVEWTQASSSPWNAMGPGDVKYDFAALATTIEGEEGQEPAIFTFGGDRETFNFFDPFNYLNMDNDVWRFAPPPKGCPGDFNGDEIVDGFDVTVLLGAWGSVPPMPEEADMNADGVVDGTDLAILISLWGACN
ncbi:MAG: dockerin type I domain-containing protein [Phycisphaerales bacterium]|nr:dockerin type I domain-containing protein [Phycisphaerales bacterium]